VEQAFLDTLKPAHLVAEVVAVIVLIQAERSLKSHVKTAVVLVTRDLKVFLLVYLSLTLHL
jgi:hypothetical protein